MGLWWLWNLNTHTYFVIICLNRVNSSPRSLKGNLCNFPSLINMHVCGHDANFIRGPPEQTAEHLAWSQSTISFDLCWQLKVITWLLVITAYYEYQLASLMTIPPGNRDPQPCNCQGHMHIWILMSYWHSLGSAMIRFSVPLLGKDVFWFNLHLEYPNSKLQL